MAELPITPVQPAQYLGFFGTSNSLFVAQPRTNETIQQL